MHVDSTILKRIQQGDKGAFSLLVDRFQKPLFSYVGKMGLSQAIAEEVAQETFIRAWQWLALAVGGIPAMMQMLALIFSAWHIAAIA